MSQSSQRVASAPRRRGATLWLLAKGMRLADWWEFKLPAPLALFCGTLLVAGEPLLPHWTQMLTLGAAIAACAAYVSMINEYFDREEDARSAKLNWLADVPLCLSKLLMLALAVFGALIAFSWRAEPQLIVVYAASWIAFTAYSAPPVRLKTRGLPGLLADAAGSTVFPVMLAVMFAATTIPMGDRSIWLAAAAVWSTGWGLRGIIWHQLIDAERDRAGFVRTFVQRRGSATARLLSRSIALPLELVGLSLILFQLGTLVPTVFLILYLGVIAGRSRLWRVGQSSGLLLDEFYDGLMPLAVLTASALRHPGDWLLLIPLFGLFGRRPTHILYHATRLAFDYAHGFSYGVAAGLRRIVRGGLRPR